MAAGDVSASTEIVRSSWAPTYGTDNGTADQSGLQRAQKPDDVVEPLRRQYHRSITCGAVCSELPTEIPPPADTTVDHVRGGCRTVPIVVIVNVCERSVVGLQACTPRAARRELKTEPRDQVTLVKVSFRSASSRQGYVESSGRAADLQEAGARPKHPQIRFSRRKTLPDHKQLARPRGE